jgi:hypothetical protein
MQRLLVILIFLFILSGINYANYTSPGAGKSWTLDSLVAFSGGSVSYSSGSYFLNDTLYISKTDTLKILYNARLNFAHFSFLYIKGTIIINPPDSVKFTVADTTLRYIGVVLDSANSSVLKKLVFEYANCINILDCSPLIDSCTLRNNYYYANSLKSGVISLFRSNATISNCKIFNNIRAAIVGGANIANSPTIINNLFYGNNISNYNTSQINLGAGGSAPIIIRNNSILRASTNSGAIAFLPVGGVPSLIIENNIIKNNRYGIALLAGGINAIINNNIIDSNNTQGSPNLGGSGLNFAGGWTTSSVICSKNTIRWNLWGITIQNTAKPNFGNLSNSDTTDNGLNKIYGNMNTGKVYDLYNNTPDSIKAENNYWGTANLDSIETHIFHKPDSSTLGFVDYLPISTISNIRNNQTQIDSYEMLEVFPNPYNPSITIKFYINNPGFIKMRVYDLLGREVYTIINENLGKGTFERNWNSGGLASGIYIISLVTQEHTFAKRIAVIK